MNKIDRYSIEFSKLYSRLMRLELLMKEKAFSAIFNYYSESSLEIFARFFNNKRRLDKYQTGRYNALRELLADNDLTKKDKFKKIICILYFSDLLELILVCEQFAKPEITKVFYVNPPKKFGKLIESRLLLRKLRNTIAHYNFDKYAQNKENYWDALLLFENHIGHNIRGIERLPVLGFKPPIVRILQSIADFRPDLFDLNLNEENQMIHHYNKQRLLLDLFDEIAIYNGYDSTELHSPWSIFREVFRFKKENTNSVIQASAFDLDLIFE